jgi:hypothetical protein
MMLGLLLALRLLSPAGFMPAFANGQVTIVVCPDVFAAPIAAHHHHRETGQSLHQHCPYASAAGLGALAADFAPLLGDLIPAATGLVAGTIQRSSHDNHQLRPPTRAPPIPS